MSDHVASRDEINFRKRLNIEKGIDIITLDIVWDTGGVQVDTKFRFDKRLIKTEYVPEQLREQAEFNFCRAIWGALQFSTEREVRSNMFDYVNKYFNDEIKDIHFFKAGRADEPFTLIITDSQTGKQITWLKFLHEIITDEAWREYQDSTVGTNTVAITN